MLKRKVVVSQSGITAGQMQDFWRMVGDGTLDGEVLAYVLTNIGRLRKEALAGDFLTPTRARKIMGKNFFGQEEAEKLFGVKPSDEEQAVLARIPFTEEELKEARDTHILAAVFPLSLLQIKEKAEHLFYKQDWYQDQAFAKEQGKAEWALVHKDIVPDSANETWDNQQTLLQLNEEVPAVRVMAYAVIGHCLATGERLLPSIYARCKDFSSGGCRVGLGGFDSGGLGVDGWRGGGARSGVGLASARKVQSS